MRYQVLGLRGLVFTTFLSVLHIYSVAQTHTPLDRAKMGVCLTKGKVGNFVRLEDSTFMCDVRERSFQDRKDNQVLFDLLRFLRHHIGYEYTRGDKIAFVTSGKGMDTLKHLHLGGDPEPALDETEWIRSFSNTLPYNTDIIGSFSSEYKGEIITLRRIVNISPVSVEADYINLIALIYREGFPETTRNIKILVDSGMEPNVKIVEYDFDAHTDWQKMESDIFKKLYAAN